jgi:hypothetical protein
MAVRDETGNTYYTSQKQKLLRDFDKNMRKYGRRALASSYGDDMADALLMEARQEYEALIPLLPYIGGKRNSRTANLVQSAWLLALYKALKKRGKTAEEAGRLAYEGVEAQVQSYPRFLLNLAGRWRLRKSSLKRNAALSQSRRYPGDWVYTFIEGDGQAFDVGMDYTECGICKFFHEQGADEFAPYLCLTEYPVQKAMGTGMDRTMTIAEGANRCDPRFKRGREVREGWPPQFLTPKRG